MLNRAAVMYRYGESPLQIVDYRDGGFQLRGKAVTGDWIFIAYTPHDILNCYIPSAPTLGQLLTQGGSVWVTVQRDGQVTFDEEMDLGVSDMVATVHRSGLRVIANG